LIYNNSNFEPLRLDCEVGNFKFFSAQTKFWFCAACAEGKVCFMSKPRVSQGRNFLEFRKCISSHSRDVISLDINKENALVTASSDNIICFWKSFTGVESKSIRVPDGIVSLERGKNISYVRFPFRSRKDYLLVVITSGEMYILETQTDTWMEFHGGVDDF